MLAATFNSYKAYVLDKEAPVVRGWGLRNRSSMVRIPHAVNPQATRMELRCPDATGNVYLQFAILIFMGLAGIANKEEAGQPDVGPAMGLAGQDRFLAKEQYRDIRGGGHLGGFIEGIAAPASCVVSTTSSSPRTKPTLRRG